MQYNNGSSNNSKQIMSNNSIKDNFRTPLTPLHRGGREGLHVGGLGIHYMWDRERLYYCGRERLHMGTLRRFQMCGRERVRNCGRVEFYKEGLRRLHGFRLNRFCDNTLRYAFSLIELSIVLIIIGLLVAGVVGGKSLIDSAKTRALMNEIRGYKQAVNTYYAANGKLPGDINNTGRIGYLTNIDNIDNPYCAVFIHALYDLNREGIIDFDYDVNKCSNESFGKQSNILKDTYYTYLNIEYDPTYDGGAWGNSIGHCGNRDENFNCFGGICDNLNGNILKLSTKYHGIIPVKMAKSVDEKMDDGKYNDGSIRAMNFYNSGDECDRFICDYAESGSILPYDDAIKKKDYYTDEMIFKLDL